MKKNETIKKIIIVISLIILIPNSVCARSWVVDFASTGGGGNTSDGDSELPGEDWHDIGEPDDYEWYYECKYNYSVNPVNNMTMKIFDGENNYINKNNIIPSVPVKAGTSIGLNIYENKIITWDVTYSVRRWHKRYWCTYKTRYSHCNDKDEEGNCIYSYSYYTYPYTQKWCDETYIGGETGWTYDFSYKTYESWGTSEAVTSGEYYDMCKTKSILVAQGVADNYKGSSYKITYPNSNDINESDGAHTVYGTGECRGPKKITDETGHYVGNYNCNYSYNIDKKTCINALNGNVEYKKKCDTMKEIEVKKTCYDNDCTYLSNTNNHWHYFIPLNAKSNSLFSIGLMPKNQDNSDGLNLKQCYYVISNHEDYKNLLTLDAKGTIKFDKDSTFEQDKNRIEKNGTCYLSSNVEIPITQKFYKEVNTKNTTINGFNFYYRPIDINNPFPNKIGNNSLWKDYWNKTKKELTNITLTNSYSNANITYYTLINESLISKYNKENDGKNLLNPYTDWSEMTIDGESNIITNGIESTKIIFRSDNVSFYKLGCGPQNIDKYLSNGHSNPYYQEECGGKS